MTSKSNISLKTDSEIRQTLKKKLSSTDKLFYKLTDPVFGKPEEKSKEKKLAQLTEEQRQQLNEIEGNAIAGFIGQLNELESALGMLMMGHHFGWKVLYIIHSKKTIRNYEDILGIKIRDVFPEEGPSAYRSNGLQLANKATNFWKVVSGEEKIENKRLAK
jgi:hypothetical protein